MQNSIRLRTIVGLVLLVGAVLLPWFILLPLALFACFYFPRYYEILAVGLLRDILYGYAGALPMFSIIALALWLFSLYIRPRITLH